MSTFHNTVEVGDVDEVGFVFLAHIDTTVDVTASAGVATVTHAGHGLVTGDKVVITGATEGDYNGEHTITVVDDNTYTYPIAADAPESATGTPTETSPLKLVTPTAVEIRIRDGNSEELNQPLTEASDEVDLGAVLGAALREKLARRSGNMFTASDIATGQGVVRLRWPVDTDGTWQYVCTATAGIEGVVRAVTVVRPALRT